MKNHLNKDIVTTKEDNEEFENSATCWVCDKYYIDTDIKV